MTKVLLIAAGLGLAASGAQACEYMRSAKSEQIDKTTVASVTVPQSEPVIMQEPVADEPTVEMTAE